MVAGLVGLPGLSAMQGVERVFSTGRGFVTIILQVWMESIAGEKETNLKLVLYYVKVFCNSYNHYYYQSCSSAWFLDHLVLLVHMQSSVSALQEEDL